MTSPTQDSKAPSSLPVPESSLGQPLPVPATTSEGGSEAPPTQEPLATSTADLDKRLAFAEQTHQYIRENIRLADQKAMFLFTAGTALLAFLYRSGISSMWHKPILLWNVLDVAAFVAMVGLAVSAIVSLLVIIPRTPGSRRGYLFWEAIAEYDASRQYADDLATISLPTLLQIRAEHCHDLARVCRRKYKMLRAALWVGTAGLAATVVVFLFLH